MQEWRVLLDHVLSQVDKVEHVFSGHYSFHQETAGAAVGSLRDHSPAGYMDQVNDHPIIHLKPSQTNYQVMKLRQF